MFIYRNINSGYTIIELLIVISIIAILASVIIPYIGKARDKAYYAEAQSEFKSIHKSLLLYQIDYGDYPADTSRSVPPGLEAYLGPGIWPGAAWPGSVLDWDNWADPDDPTKRILQISARFCDIGDPSSCQFPNEDWAASFDINSSVYYCIEGACRAHIGQPINHPGLCINC